MHFRVKGPLRVDVRSLWLFSMVPDVFPQKGPMSIKYLENIHCGAHGRIVPLK